MKVYSVIPKCLLALSICSIFIGVGWSADKDESDIAKRIDSSAKVLNEIMATPDKAIPDKVMHDAKCIAVIPSMVKIAVGFGGNHGKGIATCRTESGWSAPAPITRVGFFTGPGPLRGFPRSAPPQAARHSGCTHAGRR